MARNCRQAKDLNSTSYVKIKDSVVRNAERGRQKAEGGKRKTEGGVPACAAADRPAGGTPALQGAQQAEPERNSGRIRRG